MELGHLSERSEPREAEWWRLPACEDERESLRRSGEELVDDLADVRCVVDDVEIIEHERRRLGGELAELAKEGLHHVVARRWRPPRLAKQRVGGGREPGMVDPEGRRQVGDEPDPVSIAAIQAEPHRANARTSREVGEKRCFSVSRLRRDEDDSAVDLEGEPLEQAIAGERFVAKRWRLDFLELDRELRRPAGQARAAGSGRRW
jgi:hypothetical protein